jgi:tRNA(Phe) wybutosine-synthesizing methylase Tyw3
MKLFVILTFLTTLVFASDESSNIKTQILEKIISEISIDKEIKIWSDNKNILSTLKEKNNFNTTSSCVESSIVILQDKDNLTNDCNKKHIFVLNYKLLSEIPQSFGALFWKKGRPNIVIIKSRINNQVISVTNDLKPYLEDKIW